MKDDRLDVAFLALLTAGAVILGPVPGTRAQAPVRNLSLISTSPADGTPAEPGVSTCAGLWRYGDLLPEIGLSGPDLTGEVTCVVADLDTNGYLDFVVWGRLEPGGQGERRTRPFGVLYFRARMVIRTEAIRIEQYDHAVVWRRGSGHSGACPIAPQDRDGIKLPGEGGGTWFHMYDPVLQRLRGELVCDE